MSKIPDELWKEKNPALRGTQSSEPAMGCNPEAMQGGCNERISIFGDTKRKILKSLGSIHLSNIYSALILAMTDDISWTYALQVTSGHFRSFF